MTEKNDKHLENAIDSLKNLGNNNGYMVCISILDGEKLNHFSYLGAGFKHEDVDDSFKEQSDNVNDLILGRAKDNKQDNVEQDKEG